MNGDEVATFDPLFSQDDVVYASKTFVDTCDNLYLPDRVVRGGTGYLLLSEELPANVEAMRPDFSPWPWWNKSLGFTTRGCVRDCGFCVVRQKEGKLRIVAEFQDVWTGGEMLFLDANITAAPMEHFRKVCADATKQRVSFQFTQGLDARLFTEEHARLIKESTYSQQIHMAFDDIKYEQDVRRAISLCKAAGINTRSRLMFYTLIGFNSTEEEDLYRIELLRSLDAVPYVMPYDRTDKRQRDMARWVNHMAVFRSCTWDEYRKR